MDLIAWAPIVGPLLTFGAGVLAITKTARTAKLGIKASVQATREQDARSARDLFAPQASDVRVWLHSTAAEHYGADVDYFPQSPNGSFRSVSDALGALRRIADLHPDLRVRGSAASLYNSMDGAFGDASARSEGPPDLDDFSAWITQTDALIQLIHEAAEPVH